DQDDGHRQTPDLVREVHVAVALQAVGRLGLGEGPATTGAGGRGTTGLHSPGTTPHGKAPARPGRTAAAAAAAGRPRLRLLLVLAVLERPGDEGAVGVAVGQGLLGADHDPVDPLDRRRAPRPGEDLFDLQRLLLVEAVDADFLLGRRGLASRQRLALDDPG